MRNTPKSRARVHHIQCVASEINGITDVGHMDSLPPEAQALVRSHLAAATEAIEKAELDPALEDIPLPIRCDPTPEQELAFWDRTPWPDTSQKVTTLETVPPSIRADVSLLLHEVTTTLLEALQGQDEALIAQSAKQFLYFPRLIFAGHNNRGGRRGSTTRARDIMVRLNAWKKGAWQELWSLSAPPPRRANPPPPRTPKQVEAAHKQRVEKLVQGKAVGKAMRAVLPEGALAEAHVAIGALPKYFPTMPAFSPPLVEPPASAMLDRFQTQLPKTLARTPPCRRLGP